MEVIRYTLPSTILEVVTDYSTRANTTTNLLTFTRKDKISITRHFPVMLMLILNPETMQNANHMSCFLLDFSSHIIKRQFSQPNHARSLFPLRCIEVQRSRFSYFHFFDSRSGCTDAKHPKDDFAPSNRRLYKARIRLYSLRNLSSLWSWPDFVSSHGRDPVQSTVMSDLNACLQV